MRNLNEETRARYDQYVRLYDDPQTAEVLAGRDLDLCLGEVRRALENPNYAPVAGACPLPGSHR
jgi:hypothetical protein